MFDRDKWQEIFSTLRKNKLRTFLTAFGVFWGIFMLMIMLGSGNGLQNGVTQGFGDFATNSFFIWTNSTTMPYKGFPRGRRFWFNNEDIKALRENVSEIKYLAPKIQGWGGEGSNNAVRGLRTGSFRIQGDYPEFNLIDPVNLNGRFVNDFDIENKRKVAVIGSRVYDMLFEPGEDAIGEYIRLKGVYFKVVGIFTPKGKQDMGPDKTETIIIPFTTLQKVYNYGDVVGYFAITSKDDISATIAEEKVKKILAQRHSIHPDDKFAFGGYNIEEEFKKMTGLFLGINMLIWIVGIGTLIAGVIGVSNIMLVIIKERTREIGIKRAIGATPFSIVAQIIQESIFLTSIAGFWGLVAGVWILEGVASSLPESDTGMFANPEVDFNIAIKALILLIIAGALAGLIPAKRAVSIKPIDAIRNR